MCPVCVHLKITKLPHEMISCTYPKTWWTQQSTNLYYISILNKITPDLNVSLESKPRFSQVKLFQSCASVERLYRLNTLSISMNCFSQHVWGWVRDIVHIGRGHFTGRHGEGVQQFQKPKGNNYYWHLETLPPEAGPWFSIRNILGKLGKRESLHQ